MYEGCAIDYRGADVTPQNFINVMLGDRKAMKGVGTGKVLVGDPDAKVFVNFVDHGATGLIAFPDDYMYADTLIETIGNMSAKHMYGQMVMYIEACESGSMFDGLLPNNTEVYVTTAADPY